MKALKEKRISLRSLWRRGLVILSLFALVFASCGDSSSPSEPAEQPEVDSIAIILPAAPDVLADQYEGVPINLKGVSVVVKYKDGRAATTFSLVDHPDNYTIKPPVAAGILVDDAGDTYWAPVTKYDLTVIYGSRIATKELTFPRINGMRRQQGDGPVDFINPIGTVYKYDVENYFSGKDTTWSGVLNLWADTGDEAYVDELPVMASDAKMRVLYSDAERKDFPLEYADLEIVTAYKGPEGSERAESGPGELQITVGQGWPSNDKYRQSAIDYARAQGLTGAVYSVLHTSQTLTTTLKYKLVHHVTKIDVKDPDDWPYIYYWEGDTVASWANALAAKVLVITYSNKKTKESKISEINKIGAAKGGGIIWWNPNPDPTWTPVAVHWNVVDSEYAWLTDEAGGVPPKKKAAVYAKIAEPKVKIYYRGATTYCPVDIYTNIQNFDAHVTGEAPLKVDFLLPAVDNDVAIPGGDGVSNAKEFGAALTVEVKYGSIRGGEKTVALAYTAATPSTGATALAAAQLGAPSAGIYTSPTFVSNHEYYTLDFGDMVGYKVNSDLAVTLANKAAAYAAGTWGVSKNVKEGGSTGVTVYYRPPTMPTSESGIKDLKLQKIKITEVAWKNVPKP